MVVYSFHISSCLMVIILTLFNIYFANVRGIFGRGSAINSVLHKRVSSHEIVALL